MSFWWWKRSPTAFTEIKIAALDVPSLVGEENEEKVTRYARILDSLPPVVVFDVGGDLVVVDGYHRINAARCLGRRTIKAQILRGTWDDACAFAVYTLAAELGVAVEVALDKIRQHANNRYIVRRPGDPANGSQFSAVSAIEFPEQRASSLMADSPPGQEEESNSYDL